MDENERGLYTVDLTLHGLTDANVEEVIDLVRRKFPMVFMIEFSVSDYARRV